ncbi:MAG: molybdate ABC transporter substrate-binding protein, partial [Actinobacteria bacterium]
DPAGISSIADLAKPGVQLVLAAKGVPVGDYARQALTSAGLLSAATQNVVSNEDDDASVVAKITSGEADAGIVYASDVATAGNTVRSVTIPTAVNVVASYPIAVVAGSPQTEAAMSFLNEVIGVTGQATLKDSGFGPAA